MILAKYPFLSRTSAHIKETGVELEDVISSVIFEEARELALGRVLSGVKGTGIMIGGNEEQVIFSYPIARAIVSSIGDDYLVSRYALSEAKSSYRYLRNESALILAEVAHDLSIDFSFDDQGVKVVFQDFLALSTSTSLRSSKWRLVNREICGGYIRVSQTEFARLLQERIRSKILRELPLAVPANVVKKFEDYGYLQKIKDELAKRRRGTDIRAKGVKSEWLPPCIKSLMQRARNGENLSHSARFALTSFLNKLNVSEERILDLLSSSPDFDETLARYQVEHIIGKTSSTSYSPPSCPAMKSSSLCTDPDELCAVIKHPLTYYFRKARRG